MIDHWKLTMRNSCSGIVALFVAFISLSNYNGHTVKYKALFLDIDGTTVWYKDPHTILPSPRVTRAIIEASKHVHICLATGRPLFMLEHILENLQLTDGLAVINDGAQLIDITTRKMLYKKALLREDVAKVASYLGDHGLSFYLNDGLRDTTIETIPATREVLNIFTIHQMALEEAELHKLALSKIPTIKVSMTHHGTTEKYELLISHAEATKLHGIIEASRILKVKKEETIGIGDSGNDFPLLMASGLKVAMGNAIPDLKAVADYVAPSVEDDGVADVIEKFILPKK